MKFFETLPDRCPICSNKVISLHLDKQDGIYTCPVCGEESFCVKKTTKLPTEYSLEIKRYIKNLEFDTALERIDELLTNDDYKNSSRLYFFRTLASHQIVYLVLSYTDDKNEVTYKQFPTFINLNIGKVLESDDAKKTLELALLEDRETENKPIFNFYKQEFEKIDVLRDEIEFYIKDKRYDFDIFISFKQTEINNPNALTYDCKVAEEIYHSLKERFPKLKIFYSPITLKDMIGEDYEKVIFTAIHKAKAMLLVGFSKNNLNWTWVRNEWKRYLRTISLNNKAFGSLIPITDDNSKLPDDISKRQAALYIESNKNAFYNSLYKRLEDLLNENIVEEVNKRPEKKDTVVVSKINTIQAIDLTLNKNDNHLNINDYQTILSIAKFDKEQALKKLDGFDQKDPRVNSIRFIIKYDEIDNSKYVLKDKELDKEYYSALKDTLSKDNIEEVLTNLVNSITNTKTNWMFDNYLINYIAPYISNVNEDLRKLYYKKIESEINILFTKDEATTDITKSLVHLYLGYEEIDDNSKKQLMVDYVIYLSKIASSTYYLQSLGEEIKYLPNEVCPSIKKLVKQDKSYTYNNFLFDVGNVRNSFLLLDEDISLRAFGEASYLCSMLETRAYTSYKELFDSYYKLHNLLSDNVETRVLLNYFKMAINAQSMFYRFIENQKYDLDASFVNIENIYNDILILLNNVRPELQKTWSNQIKNIYYKTKEFFKSLSELSLLKPVLDKDKKLVFKTPSSLYLNEFYIYKDSVDGYINEYNNKIKIMNSCTSFFEGVAIFFSRSRVYEKSFSDCVSRYCNKNIIGIHDDYKLLPEWLSEFALFEFAYLNFLHNNLSDNIINEAELVNLITESKVLLNKMRELNVCEEEANDLERIIKTFSIKKHSTKLNRSTQKNLESKYSTFERFTPALMLIMGIISLVLGAISCLVSYLPELNNLISILLFAFGGGLVLLEGIMFILIKASVIEIPPSKASAFKVLAFIDFVIDVLALSSTILNYRMYNLSIFTESPLRFIFPGALVIVCAIRNIIVHCFCEKDKDYNINSNGVRYVLSLIFVTLNVAFILLEMFNYIDLLCSNFYFVDIIYVLFFTHIAVILITSLFMNEKRFKILLGIVTFMVLSYVGGVLIEFGYFNQAFKEGFLFNSILSYVLGGISGIFALITLIKGISNKRKGL